MSYFILKICIDSSMCYTLILNATVQETVFKCPDASSLWFFAGFPVVTVHKSLNYCTDACIDSFTSGNPLRFTPMGAIKDYYFASISLSYTSNLEFFDLNSGTVRFMRRTMSGISTARERRSSSSATVRASS